MRMGMVVVDKEELRVAEMVCSMLFLLLWV